MTETHPSRNADLVFSSGLHTEDQEMGDCTQIKRMGLVTKEKKKAKEKEVKEREKCSEQNFWA